MFSALVQEKDKWLPILDRMHHTASTRKLPFLSADSPLTTRFLISTQPPPQNPQGNLQTSITIYTIPQKFINFQQLIFKMPSRTLNLPLQLLLFLRLGQIACTTLTIYAACFYIGFYVIYRRQRAPPPAEYFILFTVRRFPFPPPFSFLSASTPSSYPQAA
jgi:hypothetical protein